MHRPAKVDKPDVLSRLLATLDSITQSIPLIFPIHPRTSDRIEEFGLAEQWAAAKGGRVFPPCGYPDFLALTCQARFIVTDSGGLQEESTALGIPRLTMREQTEQPVTVDVGSSSLVGHDLDQINACFHEIVAGTYKSETCPELWEGQAAAQIASTLSDAAPAN